MNNNMNVNTKKNLISAYMIEDVRNIISKLLPLKSLLNLRRTSKYHLRSYNANIPIKAKCYNDIKFMENLCEENKSWITSIMYSGTCSDTCSGTYCRDGNYREPLEIQNYPKVNCVMMECLDMNINHYLPNLKILEVEMISMYNDFRKLKNLKELSLYGKRYQYELNKISFSRLPQSLKLLKIDKVVLHTDVKLENLQMLEISESNFDSYRDLKMMPKLEYLKTDYYGYNEDGVISSHSIVNSKLKNIIIKGTYYIIKLQSDAFKYMDDLEILSLRYAELPSSFDNLSNLKYLKIKNCCFNDGNDFNFDNMKKLEILVCPWFRVANLNLQYCVNLIHLNIMGTKADNNSIRNLRSLLSLDICGTNITDINHCEDVTELDISSTDVTLKNMINLKNLMYINTNEKTLNFKDYPQLQSIHQQNQCCSYDDVGDYVDINLHNSWLMIHDNLYQWADQEFICDGLGDKCNRYMVEQFKAPPWKVEGICNIFKHN